MYTHGSKNILSLAKKQYKFVFLLSILPAIVFILISPLAVSIKNLDSVSSAMVIERIFPLAGILLLTPLCQPEASSSVKELVVSKKISANSVILLRYLLILILLPILICIACSMMYFNNSVFPFAKFVFGGFVTAFSLGCLGFSVSYLSNNWILGYLFSVFYYSLNVASGPRLKKFYLFSMSSTNGEIKDKYFLLIFWSAVIALSFVLKRQIDKNKGYI